MMTTQTTPNSPFEGGELTGVKGLYYGVKGSHMVVKGIGLIGFTCKCKGRFTWTKGHRDRVTTKNVVRKLSKDSRAF